MNLILNAIEAIKDTGGVVTVKSQLAEDGQIEISVNDAMGLATLFSAPDHSNSSGKLAHQQVNRGIAWRTDLGQRRRAGVARRSTSPCRRLPRKQTLPWMPLDSTLSKVGRFLDGGITSFAILPSPILHSAKDRKDILFFTANVDHPLSPVSLTTFFFKNSQKSHVKPQNHLTHSHPITSTVKFSYLQSAILKTVEKKQEKAPQGYNSLRG